MRTVAAPSPIRVLCVDDLPDITAVMRLVIDGEPDMECVGCLASAHDLVEKARDLKPDVIVLDATIPGVGKSPFEAMSELSKALPQVKTIIYSGYHGPAFIDSAMDAGAWGCVSKNHEPEMLLRAVREVAAGNTFLSASPTGR